MMAPDQNMEDTEIQSWKAMTNNFPAFWKKLNKKKNPTRNPQPFDIRRVNLVQFLSY